MPTDDELVKEMEILLQEVLERQKMLEEKQMLAKQQEQQRQQQWQQQQQNIRDWITLDVARSAMVIGLVTSIVLATRYGYHFSTQRH